MADSLYEKAMQMFPRLPKDLAYRENIGGGPGMLEFYPEGEDDSFDKSRPAVEVFSPRARPQDVAGDIVSHHMIDSDPSIAQSYRSFLMSMRPSQQRMLQRQYDHARKNGEARDFSKWAEVSGEPAFFRGAMFDQWPDAERIYTPEQQQLFGRTSEYLKGSR